MPRGTTLRNVRIDDDRWAAFGAAVEGEGRDRSAVLRDLIDAYLAGLIKIPLPLQGGSTSNGPGR